MPPPAGPVSERAILACGRDPAAERWTIGLWAATADLLLCRHAYAEEGAYDGGGRWRRRHIRHDVAGRPADLARVTAMAEHFCGAVRASARVYAQTRGGNVHARRSFESAFAERLEARLRTAIAAARAAPESAATHAAQAEANDAMLRRAGIDLPNRRGGYDRSGRDRAAVRHGRAAAENLSLVLRTHATVSPSGRSGNQMHFGF